MAGFPNHSLIRHTVLPHKSVSQPVERVPLAELAIPEQNDHIYEKYNCEIYVTSTVPFLIRVNPDSSVNIVTRDGQHGPGIESRWGGEIFRTRPDHAWGPLSLLHSGYRVFPGGKAAGACGFGHPPHQASRLKKE